jgi:hypothetical protein
MAVISRSTSSAVMDSGETVSVFVENLTQAIQPSTFIVPGSGKDKLFRVFRDSLVPDKTEQVGWGAGTRLLFLTTTNQGVPTQISTPVIVLSPKAESGGRPCKGTFLESVIDPVIVYDNIQKKITLFYYVNAWSPPLTPALGPPGPPPPPPPSQSPPGPPTIEQFTGPLTLFSGVVPPALTQVDPDYYENSLYRGSQPLKDTYTSARDVPNWYTKDDWDIEQQNNPDIDDIPGLVSERVGPFDLARFFVAPFTDGHLYRFPDSLDGFTDPNSQKTTTTSTTTTTTTEAPLSPPPPPEPAQDLLQSLPFITVPQTDITQATLAVLFKVQNEQTLTSLEEETYDCYKYTLARISGLTRCTRVLMRAEGFFYNLQLKQDGMTTTTSTTTSTTTTTTTSTTTTTTTTQEPDQINKSDLYLVVSHPKPVMAFPRGVNKVLVGRPKLTTFIGADVFITAAMTYRYPAAGSVSLCGGIPQVDFTIHSTSDRFDENRRMGLLPESQTVQHAPFDTSTSYTVPGVDGASIAEVLFDLSQW